MKNYIVITLLLLIPLLGLMAQPTDEERRLLDRAPGDTAAKADRNQLSPQTDNGPQTTPPTDTDKAPYFAVFADIAFPQYRLNEGVFIIGMPIILDSIPGLATSRLAVEPFANSNYHLFIVGFSVPVVTDFKDVSVAAAPKIGFGLVNVLNIYAQYDWHFLNSRFSSLRWGYRAAGRSDPLT